MSLYNSETFHRSVTIFEWEIQCCVHFSMGLSRTFLSKNFQKKLLAFERSIGFLNGNREISEDSLQITQFQCDSVIRQINGKEENFIQKVQDVLLHCYNKNLNVIIIAWWLCLNILSDSVFFQLSTDATQNMSNLKKNQNFQRQVSYCPLLRQSPITFLP